MEFRSRCEPRNWLFRGPWNALQISTFLRGITKAVPNYSVEFFLNKIPVPSLGRSTGGGRGGRCYVGPIYCHDLLSNVYSFSFSSENNSVQLHFFPSWNKISKKSKNRKEPIRWKCPEFSGNIMPAFQYIKSTFQLILCLRNLSFWWFYLFYDS
jgi:hypothetical protein